MYISINFPNSINYPIPSKFINLNCKSKDSTGLFFLFFFWENQFVFFYWEFEHVSSRKKMELYNFLFLYVYFFSKTNSSLTLKTMQCVTKKLEYPKLPTTLPGCDLIMADLKPSIGIEWQDLFGMGLIAMAAHSLLSLLSLVVISDDGSWTDTPNVTWGSRGRALVMVPAITMNQQQEYANANSPYWKYI